MLCAAFRTIHCKYGHKKEEACLLAKAQELLPAYDPTAFQVFVISLAHRTDRRDHMREQLEGHIKYSFFDAVRPDEKRAPFQVLPRGKLGCALSHRAMWLRAATDNANTLILEDDVVVLDWNLFYEQIDSLLQNTKWDIAFLGHCFETESANSCIRGFKQSVQPLCLHAYMVTPSGARLLLRNTDLCSHNDQCVKQLIKQNRMRGVSAFPSVIMQTSQLDSVPTLPSDLSTGTGFI